MKLRRAMAVAAATAVIAPAAFLAAPAAYATDGTTSTTSGTTGGTETGTTDGATATDEGTKTDDTAATTEDGTKTDDGAASTEDGTKTDEGSKTEDDTVTGGTEAGTDKPGTDKPGTDKPGTEAGTDKPGTETGKDEEEAGEGETGEDEEIIEEEICEQAAVDVSLSNLPGTIVAGSGWKNFQLNVKNNSKEALDEVVVGAWASYADDVEGDADTDRLVEKYAKIEYKLPNGQWDSGANLSGQNIGFFFDVVKLKKDENRTIQLRISIDKAAPAGTALGFAATGYDKNDECYEDYASYDFQVLAAGSNGGGGGEAKPSDEKPADLKPQGGSTPITVEGELAETGSSSMLPTIGIAGGITVVAGAGVVFALRRRNGGATA